MKRLTIFLLIFALLLSSTVAFADDNSEVKFTKYKDADDEVWLWEELNKNSPNEYIAAGVMGYFWRESQFKSDSITGWATLAQTGFDLSGYVLKEVDPGLSDASSKDRFIDLVRACGGFGLGQWYSLGYLYELYDYASEYGTSIGDARMQCEFIFYSMEKNELLWINLLECESAQKAGELIGILYDGSEAGYEYMGYKANEYYETYHIEDEIYERMKNG